MEKCNKIGCEKEATHAPRLVIPNRSERLAPIHMVVGLRLCEEHAGAEFDVQGTLELEQWKGLIQRFNLDASAAKSYPIPLDSAEVRALEGPRQK